MKLYYKTLSRLIDEGQIRIGSDFAPGLSSTYNYYDRNGNFYRMTGLHCCPFGKPVALVKDDANPISVYWAKLTKPGHAIESQYFYEHHTDLFEWKE